MARPTNDRISLALALGLSALALLWGRCVWLQVVAADRYVAVGSRQHVATEPLAAHRGRILDRMGRPLAVSLPAPSVFANPRAIAAKRPLAERLAKLLGRDARMMHRRLERDKAFVWVARQVDRALVPELATLRAHGVGIREELSRVYPQGQLASHIAGFVDIDQGGLEGLELAFDGVLQGEPGWRATLRDARGALLIGPWTTTTSPLDGYDLVLTIDSVVQQAAEEVLEWGVSRYHAQGGSLIVMEPASGAILAMANAPTYDANAPAEAPAAHRRNRAITDLLEPGSIFKIVPAAALLEEGKISVEERIFCERGAYPTVGGHILHDHRPHALLSFHDVITFSSNIGTAKAAQRLSPEELYRYIRVFGFGRATGIELPGEVQGLLRPPAEWSKLSPFIIPIGQEVAVTPIQLAVMTAVVANGGFRVRPFVVQRVQTADGELVRDVGPSEPVRILSPQTAHTLQQMLLSVVASGTGQLAQVEGLAAAGKTGTAQKLEPNGRYSHSRYVASFVGFVPVPDPRVAVVVCVDEPRPLYFGGVVAAPMFQRLMERLAGYLALERSGDSVMARLP
jgi:cell division protein FtsI (penicillin-binding protein 3)